jgi:hypothetical protein
MTAPQGCHDDPDPARDAWCSCPVAHPLLALALWPVWWLLPGRLQGWVCGAPCWAPTGQGHRDGGRHDQA